MTAVVAAPRERRVVPSGSLDASDTSAVLGARGGRGRRIGLRVLAVALLLGIWWLISAWGEPDEVIRPSPGLVWDTFVQLTTVHDGVRGYNDKFLWEHLDH